MRKLIFLILIFHSSFLICRAQWWIQQESGVTNTLSSVNFSSAQTGWSAGSNGTIIKTTNGGTNWFIQTSGIDVYISAISFLNENTGWAAGYKTYTSPTLYRHVIFKTTNSGLNWLIIYDISIPFIDIRDIRALQFVNSSVGYYTGSVSNGVSAGGCMYKSTNGGVNWTEVNFTGGKSLFFPSENIGYLASFLWNDSGTDTAFVKKTTDSGGSWVRQGSWYKYSFDCIYFYNNLTGWICGNNHNGIDFFGIIMKTTNGGLNWSYIPRAEAMPFTSIYFPSFFTGYVCGQGGGSIYKSTDGGDSWYAQSTGITNSLTSIYFVNDYTGWSVGYSGKIVKTITGGINGIIKLNDIIPEKFLLYQNYPNPFNPVTIIKLQIADYRLTTLKIFDALGKEIATLVNESLKPGTYEVEWQADNFPSGVYFAKLEAGHFSETKKMVLMK